MKRYSAFLLAFLLLMSLLSGCGKENSDAASKNDDRSESTSGVGSSGSPDQNIGDQNETSGENTETVDVDFSQTDDDMFTNRDERTAYEENSAVQIQLKGSTAAASSNTVQISSSTVQITQEGTYLISGTLDDGMLVVNAPKDAKLQLVFNGVDITSSTCAALYILEADKVVITLADGTQNSLSNGGEFVAIDDNNIDAALFSKQDLTINGSGSLTVTSPAGHGIVCKDDLVVTGGTIQVDAASHALDANDSVRFTGASLSVTAGKDGIHCEHDDDPALGFIYISGGSMKIDAQGDGISAGGYLHITDGTFDIVAGGGSENGNKTSSSNWGGFMGGGFNGGRPGHSGSTGNAGTTSTTDDSSTSMKGIKSEQAMQIDGGNFAIDSADDALHSNTSMTVNSGTFAIASGDDALHAEDTLTVNDGMIRITESYEGLEALHLVITGGDIDLVSVDDGLNAAGGTDSSGITGGRDGMFGGHGGFGGMSGSSNGSILIAGGTLHINASGDGIDANGTLEITGGYTVVVGPTQGDTATLDYDISAVISGGTFIGTGASSMAQSISGSGQGVFAVTVGQQTAGTQITLTDTNGAEVLSYAPELPYQVVILSSPDIISGETYTITVGELSGTFEAS